MPAESKPCSPTRRKLSNTGSCYTKFELIEIAKKHGIDVDNASSRQDLITKIKTYLSDDQTTWNTPLASKAFRPQRPLSWNNNQYEWLTNYDIEGVMQQYVEKYTSFKFLGVHPIDFLHHYPNTNKCIGKTLCEFDIKSDLIIEGKDMFGLVLNHDKHNQPGSHWVALFACINPKKVNYGIFHLDSAGNPPHSEIKMFMKRICKQMNQPQKKFRSYTNIKQYQFKNTECGMYTLIFLDLCIRGKHSIRKIYNELLPSDEVANRKRKEFFS